MSSVRVGETTTPHLLNANARKEHRIFRRGKGSPPSDISSFAWSLSCDEDREHPVLSTSPFGLMKATSAITSTSTSNKRAKTTQNFNRGGSSAAAGPRVELQGVLFLLFSLVYLKLLEAEHYAALARAADEEVEGEGDEDQAAEEQDKDAALLSASAVLDDILPPYSSLFLRTHSPHFYALYPSELKDLASLSTSSAEASSASASAGGGKTFVNLKTLITSKVMDELLPCRESTGEALRIAERLIANLRNSAGFFGSMGLSSQVDEGIEPPQLLNPLPTGQAAAQSIGKLQTLLQKKAVLDQTLEEMEAEIQKAVGDSGIASHPFVGRLCISKSEVRMSGLGLISSAISFIVCAFIGVLSRRCLLLLTMMSSDRLNW
jgi:hypothetical protein